MNQFISTILGTLVCLLCVACIGSLSYSVGTENIAAGLSDLIEVIFDAVDDILNRSSTQCPTPLPEPEEQ